MRSIHLVLIALTCLAVACGSEDGTGNNANNANSSNNANNVGSNNQGDLPRVVSITPEDGSTDVALDVVAQVTFDGEIDPATVTLDTVWIESPFGKVRAEMTYDNDVVTITPNAELASQTDYEVVVTRGVNSPDGEALLSARRAAFTTGEGVVSEAMEVDSTRPEDGARDVRVDTQIAITYLSNVEEATVDSDSFRVVDTFDNEVSGEFLVDELNIFFTPDENLDPMQTYFVTITDDVRDAEGKVGGHEWSFSTIPSIEFVASAPADESDDADIDDPLVVTLSSESELESSNAETITVTAETYFNGVLVESEEIDANFSVSGNTIIIEPQDGRWREFRTVYRVELDGVLSSAGAPLPPQEIRFSTTMFDSDWLYSLTSIAETRALAVDGSNGPYQNTAFMAVNASDSSAHWGLDRNDDGSYMVTNPASGLSLSGATLANLTDPNSVVTLESLDDSSASQRWDVTLESVSGGLLKYRMANQQFDTHSLGILDISGVYRAYLLAAEDVDGQRWTFENIGPR